MEKEELQNLARAAINAGLQEGFDASKFERYLDALDPNLEYYDDDLGYMMGFAKALLEKR